MIGLFVLIFLTVCIGCAVAENVMFRSVQTSFGEWSGETYYRIC